MSQQHALSKNTKKLTLIKKGNTFVYKNGKVIAGFRDKEHAELFVVAYELENNRRTK